LKLDFTSGSVKQLVGTIEKAALEQLEEAADDMVAYAKILCRTETGSLASTVRKERAGNAIKVRAGGYVVNPRTGKLVDYAVFIEEKDHFMQKAWMLARIGLDEKVKSRVEGRVNE